RPAGMIDVARDVAADAGVDHRAARELEAPDVALPDVPPLAREALAVRDLLARVMDNPLVLGDGPGGEDAPSVNAGPPLLDHDPVVSPPRLLYSSDRMRLWTTLCRKARSLRELVRGLADTAHPLLAQIIPIRRCNIDCGYCNEYDKVSPPVPTEVMRRRIDKLAELGT